MSKTKKYINEYAPDEIRRYALRWFDQNAKKNPLFGYMSNMLMRIGRATEMNIEAPAAVTIFKNDSDVRRVRLHVSPQRMHDMSPEAGIEISPWVLGHEMSHVIHDHLRQDAEVVADITGSEIQNEKILTTAQECICNDIFENIEGVDEPLDSDGKNPLIMGRKTPGLESNSYPMDTYEVYSIIANEYKDYQENKDSSGDGDEQNDSSDTSENSDGASSESGSSESKSSGSSSSGSGTPSGESSGGSPSNSEDGSEESEGGEGSSSGSNNSDDESEDDSDSSGDSSSDKEDDSESGDSQGAGDEKLGDMSYYDEQDGDQDSNCSHGGVLVDEDGNPIEISPDELADMMDSAKDDLIPAHEFQELEDMLNKPYNGGEKDRYSEKSSDTDNLPEKEHKRNKSGSHSTNYQSEVVDDGVSVVKVPISRDIVEGYNWSKMLGMINPVLANVNTSFSNMFQQKQNWSKPNKRFANVTRSGGGTMPEKRVQNGDMVYSMDIDIYLDVSGSMGQDDVTMAALCYYMISQVVGEQHGRIHAFASNSTLADIEIDESAEEIVIKYRNVGWGNDPYTMHTSVLKETFGEEWDSDAVLPTNKNVIIISDGYYAIDSRIVDFNKNNYKWLLIQNDDFYDNSRLVQEAEVFKKTYGEKNVIVPNEFAR